MSDEGKYRDIFTGPRRDTGGVWDKPMVLDDKSMPSRADSARFNVAVSDSRDDDAVAPKGPAGESSAEWTPSTRPWWKAGILAAAVILCSAGFVVALLRPAMPDGTAAGEVPAGVPIEAASAGPEAPPPPLMANPVADGTMKFQVLSATPDLPVVTSGAGGAAASGAFLLLEMKVVNTDAKSANFDPLAQRIITGSGRQYGPQLEAQKLFSGPTLMTGIQPGQEVVVRMAFDLPRGELPAMLFLHSVDGSYGTTVKFA